MSAVDWGIGVVAMLLGSLFGMLRLVHRYRDRSKYAMRHGWGKGLISASALFSFLIYIGLQFTGVRPVFNGRTGLNSLALAFSAALMSLGTLTFAPVAVRTRGVRTFVTASTWINEVLEKETDRVVAQDVSEIALDIELQGVSIETLQAIGNHLIQFSLPASAKRSAQLAQLDALARERNFAGIIRHLMEFCSPEWLATVAKKHSQHHAAGAG